LGVCSCFFTQNCKNFDIRKIILPSVVAVFGFFISFLPTGKGTHAYHTGAGASIQGLSTTASFITDGYMDFSVSDMFKQTVSLHCKHKEFRLGYELQTLMSFSLVAT